MLKILLKGLTQRLIQGLTQGRVPILILIFQLTGCSNQPAEPTVTQYAPYLANSQSWLMQSSTTGLNYQISVALPDDYEASDHTYHVLYGVDANMEFGTMVETARNLAAMWAIEKLVIVGIGYNVDAGWNNVMPQRALDLTPTKDDTWLSDRNRDNKKYNLPQYLGTGGAENFLTFMQRELIPTIEKKYRVHTDNRTLFGHSFGGLFASYALFQQERLFDRYIIGSPSLWWGAGENSPGAIFEQEENFAKQNASLNAKVFLSVGEFEQVHPEDERFAMISNVKKLTDILKARNYQGLSLETRILADEHHMSVIPATLSHGLRAVYGTKD